MEGREGEKCLSQQMIKTPNWVHFMHWIQEMTNYLQVRKGGKWFSEIKHHANTHPYIHTKWIHLNGAPLRFQAQPFLQSFSQRLHHNHIRLPIRIVQLELCNHNIESSGAFHGRCLLRSDCRNGARHVQWKNAAAMAPPLCFKGNTEQNGLAIPNNVFPLLFILPPLTSSFILKREGSCLLRFDLLTP